MKHTKKAESNIIPISSHPRFKRVEFYGASFASLTPVPLTKPSAYLEMLERILKPVYLSGTMHPKSTYIDD